MIKIGISGACGKMGHEVTKMVVSNPDFELAQLVDNFGNNQLINSIVVQDDIKFLNPDNIDVVVDFTQPSCVFENTKYYLEKGIKAVIGTTGLKKEEIAFIADLSKKTNTGCIIAPNFSLGAVLMMKFALMASKYFSNAEIIEYHHNQKKDAPSGTSIKTAQLMMESNTNFKLGNCVEKETINGARGACYEENNLGNIQIHSVRMPGFVASQEVIFGSDGQTLKIHHDTINRECYMSGVALAINYVYKNNSFVYGLENIL